MKKFRLMILLPFLVVPLAFAEQSNQDENTNSNMYLWLAGTGLTSMGAGAVTHGKVTTTINRNERLNQLENRAVEREHAAYKIRLSQELGEEHIKRHLDAQEALGVRHRDFFSKDVISKQTQEILRKRYNIDEEEIKTATYDKTILNKTDRMRRDNNLKFLKRLNAGVWGIVVASTGVGVTSLLLEPDQETSVEINNSELLKDLSQDESLIAEKTEEEKRSPGASAY